MKWFAIVGMILFLGVAVAPSINANDNVEKPLIKGFIKSNLELNYDHSDIPEYIQPESEIVHIEINVTYTIDGLFSRLVELLLKYKVSYGELSLDNIPDFCNAQIYPKIVYPRLRRNQTLPERTILSVSVDPTAPGFQPFNITIHATASAVKGPLGLLNIINPSDDTILIEITPGYYSNFLFDYPPFSEIPPLELTVVPVNVTSFANADVYVQTEIFEPPENWSINITSDVIVEPWGSEQFLLSIIPPDIQNEVETLTIYFNMTAWGHPEVGYDRHFIQVTVRVISRDNI